MADLFNQQISATYSGLLKTSSSGVLSASLSQISDGRGNTSPLYLSTDSIQFYGAYSFPSSDGSANQVLKTDGAGVLTWENDSLSNTLNFSGGTGTGSVTLDSQTLAFTGTANQIETSASSQAITLSFPTAGVTLPDGSVATTQTASDNSTKVATTAYVEAAVAAGGDVTKTGTITANQIAVWNDSTDELRSDETVTIGTDHSITLLQKNSLDDDRGTHNIGGGNIDDVTGQNNVGFGIDNLGYLVSGQDNNAFGNNSQISNSSGSYNTSFGNQTLNYHSSSDYNVAIGYQSLRGDNIGGTPSSDNNTAIGTFSLRLVDGGNSNTAIGYNSGNAITTGSNNVIIGSNTGSTIATSSNNIIISDGGGNIRQSFDVTGAATFNGAATFSGSVTATTLTLSTTTADYAATITNVQDSSQGLLVRATDNDGSLFLLNLQSSGSATSQTWVDRFAVTKGGNVGIGTDSPSVESGYTNLSINNVTYGGLISMKYNGTDVAKYYGDNTGLRLESVGARNMRFFLDGTERVKITSGGVLQANYGISFPNQSAGSGTPTSGGEILDAYEEGTWTPTLTDVSNNPATLNATNSVGVYTRIGNLVYYRVTIQITSLASTSSISTAFIKGFPYVSATIPGNWYRPQSTIIRNITFSGYVALHINSNFNYGYLYDNISGATGGSMEFSSYANNSTITSAGVYEI